MQSETYTVWSGRYGSSEPEREVARAWHESRFLGTGLALLLLTATASTIDGLAQKDDGKQQQDEKKQDKGKQQGQKKGQSQPAQPRAQQPPAERGRPPQQRAEQPPQRRAEQPAASANQPSQPRRPVQQVERTVWQERRATNWQSEHRTWQQRGGYTADRIPVDRYRGAFGPDHAFRIYNNPVRYPRDRIAISVYVNFVQLGDRQSVWLKYRAQRSWQSEHRSWQQRGGYNGYRIPQDRYGRYCGQGHGFRINSLPLVIVGGYPRFQYGGFWFGVVDPWPEYWSGSWYDNDDVYIDYVEDGYYLYNGRYPRDRIAISVYLN